MGGGAWTQYPRATTLRRRAIVVDELALVRAGIAAVLARPRASTSSAQTRSAARRVSVATVDRPDLVVVGAPADLPIADAVRRLVRAAARSR